MRWVYPAEERPIRYARKLCAVYPRKRSPRLAQLGKGAASPPIASPGPGPSARGPDQRRFALWTADRARCTALDPCPLFRQRLRPGEPSCPPWTSRPWETSLSPRTPIDQPSAVWTRARAFAPMDHEPEDVPPRCPCPLSRRSGAKAETLGGLDAARRHAPPKPLPRRVRPGPPALGRRTLGRGAYA